jgi:TetR/AcrR family transcriptional repressor of bet genes
MREQRRTQLVRAFVRVLAEHGQAGATVAAVAAEAGVVPGLVHHHFSDKQELYTALLSTLMQGFRDRTRQRPGAPLDSYVDAALALDARSDLAAARAWVTLFAEGLSDPRLFDKLRRAIDTEVDHVEQLARGGLSGPDASAVVAFIIGALVFGAYAPRRTAGFAAPALRKLLAALR